MRPNVFIYSASERRSHSICIPVFPNCRFRFTAFMYNVIAPGTHQQRTTTTKNTSTKRGENKIPGMKKKRNSGRAPKASYHENDYNTIYSMFNRNQTQ